MTLYKCKSCFRGFPLSQLIVYDGKMYCEKCHHDVVYKIEKKESNPKATYGDTKVGLGSLPFGPIYEMALAMTEGGLKYGKHNYRKMGCRASTYFDAAAGHLVSWWEGEDIDEESGIHHLMKAAACLIVLRDSQLMGNDVDDRPIKYPEGVPLRKNPLLKTLLAKYPNPVPPFTEKNRGITFEQVMEVVQTTIPAKEKTKPGYGGNIKTPIKDRRSGPSNYPACDYCKAKYTGCDRYKTQPAKHCASYEPRRRTNLGRGRRT